MKEIKLSLESFISININTLKASVELSVLKTVLFPYLQNTYESDLKFTKETLDVMANIDNQQTMSVIADIFYKRTEFLNGEIGFEQLKHDVDIAISTILELLDYEFDDIDCPTNLLSKTLLIPKGPTVETIDEFTRFIDPEIYKRITSELEHPVVLSIVLNALGYNKDMTIVKLTSTLMHTFVTGDLDRLDSMSKAFDIIHREPDSPIIDKVSGLCYSIVYMLLMFVPGYYTMLSDGKLKTEVTS